MDSSSASIIYTSILWRGTLAHELLPCLTSGMHIIGMYLLGKIVILLAELYRGCQEDILGQSKTLSVNMVMLRFILIDLALTRIRRRCSHRTK
jgi:hypothetical protein